MLRRFLLPHHHSWTAAAIRVNVLLAAVALIVAAGSARGVETSAGAELFEQQILPALETHCYQCHSQAGDAIEAGLELDSRAGLLRGGDSGPVLAAHNPEGSLLLRAIRHDEDASPMPPDEPLPPELIAAFEAWIRAGAPDTRAGDKVTAREARLAEAQQHWAFQRPQLAAPPDVEQTDWPRSDIDRFVLARMESAGLRPAEDANRRTLVRRAFFDLVGLPPSPAEIEEFLTDDAPEAFARLVDRLLASPRFGERWGRHWLDVVRYAESSGMEFNFTYPHAWPYRDYVIDALNSDKPYDEFLCEQIAGDLMPAKENESRKQRQARLTAPSVLAFGPKRHNSGGIEFQLDVVDDQINTVFQSTLALTVGCARCHDHKFDPISTKEYYGLAGIFQSTEPLYGTIQQKYSNNPTDLLPIGAHAEAKHKAAEAYSAVVKEYETKLAAKRTEATAAGQSIETAELKDPTPLQREIIELEQAVAELQENQPPRPQYAMSARDRAKPADGKIAIRGNCRDLGEVAPRCFLAVLEVHDAPPINPESSGRLELAKWITSRENPLTARVMVNRVWHHLFGRGLVATTDNFGVIGAEPSHPQLLDNLALGFMEDQWSVKRLIRRVMLSRTYQLSSAVYPENREIDPANRLLWRATPRRLEAEVIRDALLTVSGQLDLKRPEGSTVTGLGDRLVRDIPTEQIQPANNHRSVYLPVVRDYLPEAFDLFDFPSPSLVRGVRSVTNVPAQSLYLRNSPLVAEQARHAAERLLASDAADTPAKRADLAVRWALARPATEAEVRGAVALAEEIKAADSDGDSAEVDAWAAWFHALFATAEFRYLVDAPQSSAASPATLARSARE